MKSYIVPYLRKTVYCAGTDVVKYVTLQTAAITKQMCG